jgi:L-amino acid N-acyltransferase
MAEPTIRDATRFDHRAIRSLGPRLTEGAAPWRPAAGVSSAVSRLLEQSLGGHGEFRPIWVADLDGRVVGMATAVVREHFSGPADCYLAELVVDARYEGNGVGTALVAHAERWARERGLAALTLDIGAANLGGRDFYAQLGFLEEQVQLTKPLPPA